MADWRKLFYAQGRVVGFWQPPPTLDAADPQIPHLPLETAASGNINPNGFANVSAFGTVALNANIAPTSLTNAQAFGTVGLNANIAPAGFANAQAFGSPALNANIAPASLVNTSAFGTVSLNATIAPAGFADPDAFGTVSLNANIAPVGFIDPDAFGVPTIEAGPSPPEPPEPPVITLGYAPRARKRKEKKREVMPHPIEVRGFVNAQRFGRPELETRMPAFERIVGQFNADRQASIDRAAAIRADEEEWLLM